MAAERRIRAGVRWRTTVAATSVVGLALLIGMAAVVLSLRAVLIGELGRAAAARAGDLAGMLRSGTAAAHLDLAADEDVLVQILDPAGRAVAASPNAAGRAPIADPAPGRVEEVDVTFDDSVFLVVAEPADTPSGRWTVLVGRSLDQVFDAVQAVAFLLALAMVFLLLVVAVAGWRLVGRALAPVEEIRAEVAGISAVALNLRVTAPPGTDEISRLAATMNQMLDRLEAAQQRQRRFVSDASHELRSPVAALRQHAEVALAHPDSPTARNLAGTARELGLRIQSLVDDLLLLARADEHGLGLSRRPVDLDDLVLDEARSRAADGPAMDTSRVSGGAVEGDPLALRRIVANLVDNAARHARRTVAVSVHEADERVTLHVDDDGPGIDPTDRERVFHRFVRLDEDRNRHTGGSGLGLSIVAELVAAHGGRVTIADSPLGGARVTLDLPAARAPDGPTSP